MCVRTHMYTNVHTYRHKYISIYSKGMLTHIYTDRESVEERGERDDLEGYMTKC